jgi:hypothetical protein
MTVTKEEYLEAVRQGAYDAMWHAMTTPNGEFYDVIGEAAERALLQLGKEERAIRTAAEAMDRALMKGQDDAVRHRAD